MNKKITVIFAVILFIGVLVQSMVIIDYYSEGTNLGFFRQDSKVETYYKSLDDNVRDRFITPYNIMIRSDDKTWVFKDNENHYSNLWSDVKVIMKEALFLQYEAVETTWGQLCSERGAAVYLGGYFPIKYLDYLIGIESSGIPVGSVDKFIILPVADGLEIYLHSRDTIIKTTTETSSGLFIYENFMNFTDLLTKDPKYMANYFKDFHTFISEEILKGHIEPDIIVSHNNTPKFIPWLFVGIADDIKKYLDIVQESTGDEKSEGMESTAAKIKKKLFGRSESLYEVHFDSSDNLFFTNQFNMYEINPEGWVYYSYTPGTEGDEKGPIKEAFINAYETLNIITNLSSSKLGELYISGIIENEDSYTFAFDYIVEDGIVAIKNENHAAVITATATRTVGAWVIPLNFGIMALDSQPTLSYITSYNSVRALNGINPNIVEAYNMYIGYGEFSGNQNLLGPVWIIEKESGEKTVYDLPKGEE